MYTSRAAALAAAALVLHSHSPLRKHEIARITGLGWSSVQRAVESLRSLGLIKTTDSKGYKTYELDPASPYLPAVMRAALVDSGMIEALSPFSARLRFVMVIGSFAWGKPGSTSDIDLLVVGGVHKQDIEEALTPTGERYERRIDPIVYTDEEMRQRLADGDYLLANAISNGIRLLGDPALVPTA